MRVVDDVIFIGVIGCAAQLIRPRIHNGTEQIFEIVSVTLELLAECSQKVRMRRRIGGAEVVHRVNDALAKEVPPKSVNSRLGKIEVRDHQDIKLNTQMQ